MKKNITKIMSLILSAALFSSCSLSPMGEKNKEETKAASNGTSAISTQTVPGSNSFDPNSSNASDDKFVKISGSDARSEDSKKQVESSMLNEKGEGIFVSYEEFKNMENADDIRNGIWKMTDSVFPVSVKKSEKKNSVFSPISLFTTLAVLREGASGDTKKSVSEIMGMDSEMDLKKSMNAFTRLFNSVIKDENGQPTRNGVALSTGLFIKNGLTPKTDFLQNITDNYMSEAAVLDFNNPEASQKTIDSWVKERSRGFMEKASQVSGDTVMDIVNVFIINNMWYSGFSGAKDIAFKTESGETKNVPAMEKKNFNAFVVRGENYTAYNNTLKGGGNVWFILPDEGTDPMSIKNIQELVSSDAATMEHVMLNLTMPQLAIENSSVDLTGILKEMGYGNVFQSGADFKGIADGLFVSKINQNTTLMVDKEGFRAGAVTDIQLSGNAPAKDFEVLDLTFDRPYLIVAESYKVPLFVIKVGDPTER